MSVPHVIYLYGFVPAAAPEADEPMLEGVGGADVEVIGVDGVRAVISRLPAEAWSAAAIEPHLQDIDWVARHGLSHEQVVAWWVDHHQILPAPLFTLYSTLDALRAEVGARAGEIRTLLGRFAGLREWDFKLAYDRDRLAEHAGEVSAPVRALDDEITAAAPGRRFLLERKRAELVRTEVGNAARQVADDMWAELTADTVDAVRLALPRTNEPLPVVLNGALLVRREDEGALRQRFEERASHLHRLGMELRWSGPWAPYRFLGGRDGE